MKGKYFRKVDSKGRITIPSKWDIKEDLVIMYQHDYLVIMDEENWEKMYGIQNYEILTEKERMKERKLYSRSYKRSVDKTRRLRIGLVKLGDESNNVELIGMGNCFEVHYDKDKFKSPLDELK